MFYSWAVNFKQQSPSNKNVNNQIIVHICSLHRLCCFCCWARMLDVEVGNAHVSIIAWRMNGREEIKTLLLIIRTIFFLCLLSIKTNRHSWIWYARGCFYAGFFFLKFLIRITWYIRFYFMCVFYMHASNTK